MQVEYVSNVQCENANSFLQNANATYIFKAFICIFILIYAIY